jgi:hypothetical protein
LRFITVSFQAIKSSVIVANPVKSVANRVEQHPWRDRATERAGKFPLIADKEFENVIEKVCNDDVNRVLWINMIQNINQYSIVNQKYLF